MFQFSYKLKVAERVKAKCERHPRYNPEREGRGGIKGGCSLASLSLTYIRRGYGWTPPQGVSKKSIALDTRATIPY
jgi:hypothetical protein